MSFRFRFGFRTKLLVIEKIFLKKYENSLRLFRDLKQPPFIFAADLIFNLYKIMAAIIIFICIFSLADMLTNRA